MSLDELWSEKEVDVAFRIIAVTGAVLIGLVAVATPTVSHASCVEVVGPLNRALCGSGGLLPHLVVGTTVEPGIVAVDEVVRPPAMAESSGKVTGDQLSHGHTGLEIGSQVLAARRIGVDTWDIFELEASKLLWLGPDVTLAEIRELANQTPRCTFLNPPFSEPPCDAPADCSGGGSSHGLWLALMALLVVRLSRQHRQAVTATH